MGLKRAKWRQQCSVCVSNPSRRTRNVANLSRRARTRVCLCLEPFIPGCPMCGCCISRQPPVPFAVDVVHTRDAVIVILYIVLVVIHREYLPRPFSCDLFEFAADSAASMITKADDDLPYYFSLRKRDKHLSTLKS